MSADKPTADALATAAKPPPPREADPFRMPRVRHAMHLIVPRSGGKVTRVTVVEMKTGVRLSLDIDDDEIGVKHVDLALTETCKLSDMLNAIRRRVVARKAYAP